MGSGYIQLLTVGNEANIFNYNPNISFFKIYYRRHTNFFINNMTIEGNPINLSNLTEPNILSNSSNLNDSLELFSSNIVTFNIPKNGDLLGKSYVEFDINNYYFELFEFNNQLISTLNTDLLSVYDDYYIKTNSYSLFDIENISIVKLNYIVFDKIVFSILSSVIYNDIFFLTLIKNTSGIKLETDTSNIFYNIDLNTLYYSFNINIDNDNDIRTNLLLVYLYENINYIEMTNIQIDFLIVKFSMKVSFTENKYYKIMIDLLFSEKNFLLIKQIKIYNNCIYLSLNFTLELYNILIKLFFVNVNILNMELITNKLKSSKITITNKIIDYFITIIEDKNDDTFIYLSVLNGGNQSQSILTIMKNICFFGNLTNEYYNDFLINRSNLILNVFNLNSDKLSLNTLIKIHVSLICDEDVSIQKYLEIVNNINKKDNIQNLVKYTKNLNILNDKLIYYLMNPDVLIVNNRSFYIILYSKNTFKYFEESNYVMPFTNNIISNYTSVINNFYFNVNNLKTYSNYFNDTSNDLYYILSKLIFYEDLLSINRQKALYYDNISKNYINNNDLFKLITPIENINNQNNVGNIFSESQSFIHNDINDNENLNIITNIIYNNLLLFITQSVTLINNIININTFIYNTNGQLSNLFYNSNNSSCVIPISSYIYVYTNNSKDMCLTETFTNNNIYFNIEYDIYINNVKSNLINYTEKYLNSIKFNISTNISDIVNNSINQTDIIGIISNYYIKSKSYLDEINMSYINDYLEYINNIDYSIIYPSIKSLNINLNNDIMFQLFTYIDSNLFNNSFSNFVYNKYDKCNTHSYETNLKIELNYLKFIFTINSPLYRIYFLFTFLSKFTIDCLKFNIDNIVDVNTLRDFTILFVLNFLKIFNKININEYKNLQINYFNFNDLNNDKYYIKNNFLCFDPINIFNDSKFINDLKNNVSGNYLLLYNNFYIIQKKTDLFALMNEKMLFNIPNICNDIKYNFDDLIILLYLQTLKTNSNKFLYFDNMYNFVLNYFNKYDFDFNTIIFYFNENTNNEYIFVKNDNFYYKSYYSTYALGFLFDNITSNNINTINNIFELTTFYNVSSGYDYEYSFKEFIPKKNENYLNFYNNVTSCLEYFSLKLFNIFYNEKYLNLEYFDNYIKGIITYTNTNLIYLYEYLISEQNFNNSVGIINQYITKFNSINNDNISLTKNAITIKYNKTNFYKYNFVIIIMYYIYFINNCLIIDILSYNKDILSNIKNIINFNTYIKNKYTTNIYYDCINNLINLFYKSLNNLNLDFSTFYIPNNIINNDDFTLNTYNNNKYLFYNILENNNEIMLTNNNLAYNKLDYKSIVYFILNTNNSININANFYELYYNQIYNLTQKINNIMYFSLNNNTKINFAQSNNSLYENYQNFNKYYYTESITTLYNIYTNLNNSYQLVYKNNSLNEYSTRIITYILYNIKNFYVLDTTNYFYTLYYLNNTINNDIIKNSLLNITQDNNVNFYENYKSIYENFIRTSNTYEMYDQYINNSIISSLIYEKEMNRIIYLLCTDYLIQNSYDKNDTKNKIYSKTLYDIVKLYILEYNIDAKDKKYLNNTSIYSNQSIFELFNYENLFNNISYSQNYWINEIISRINIQPQQSNSYYILYIEFTKYLNLHNINTDLLVLENGISVLNYFKNLDNYDELTKYLFDYICLNEPFSPNFIFVNITSLYDTSTISSKIKIETNHLQKKIIVFLFFTWIILSFIPILLIEYFEVNYDIVLEYNIDINTIIDIRLYDVLKYNDNMKIIKWFINEVYDIRGISNNQYMDILNEYANIIYIAKYTKMLCSPIHYFNVLCNKYIKCYNNVIGKSDIYTLKLFLNNPYKSTLTNLVSDINIVFNNDIDPNNKNNYDLTYYSMKLLDIKLNSLIFDLNNIENNKSYNTNNFSYYSKKNYTKSFVNDFNLLYNLQCLLLNNYNISYFNLQIDFNLVLEYLRNGTNSLNELFELFKGYVSAKNISSNLISELDLRTKYSLIFSRLTNIENLNSLVNKFNNLSLITPSDYDSTIIINYNYGYKDFFEKYYSYNYNYNNFSQNYLVIYDKLFNYYQNIVSNKHAIKNIKNYNNNLYIWLFLDLINSYISNIYYGSLLSSNIPSKYINTINILIKIYFEYNYSFRLNTNIPNYMNLKIQSKYNNIPNFTNYEMITNYLINYYYYQLFSNDITNNILNDSNINNYTNDVILFFNTLDQSENINYEYDKNFLNLCLKFNVITKYLIYRINTIYGLNIKINDDVENKFNNILIDYFTNISNITEYFICSYFNTDIINNLFKIIQNLINKNKFYQFFSESISKLIFWINNLSYDENIIIVWTTYFKDEIFEYYEYINNQYVIKIISFTYNELYYLVTNYINYILMKNDGIINNSVFVKIYDLLFKNNLDSKIINPEIINNILLMNYGYSYFNKKILIDDTINNKKYILIQNIFKFITNNIWGIINYNIIDNKYNTSLRPYITYYNLYYSYLNYLLVNKNMVSLNSNSYNFEYYINIFDELFILYYLIIIIFTLQYVDISINNSLIQSILIEAHEYIIYGVKIDTLNLNINFALYMDNLNSNIIKNNNIANYYKDIQNNTIYNAIEFKINNFVNNKNNYGSYITQIYNNQLNQLNLNTENYITYNTFYNIIINTLNNLSSNIELYLDDEKKILNGVYNTIYNNINTTFSIIVSYFGGKNNNNITYSNSDFSNIFNIFNFKQENQQITIFTLINNQISNGIISDNVIIILFYYICYITWNTSGINIQFDFYNIEKIFYDLANLINKQILFFIELLNSNKIIDINNKDNELYLLNEFFNGLNILLFNNYNDYEFIKATTKYFNQIINNYLTFLPNNVITNLLNINSILYDGNNILQTNEINLTENNVMKNSLIINMKNMRIINWKYLIGLASDFNNSNLILYIKSIDDNFSHIKVQENLINYIIGINNGLINEYGIIKLINKLELLYDDEIIAQYFNYNYKIFIDNFQNINKQKLLNDMLGIEESHYSDYIISGLKPYIKFVYRKKYIIPIKFFFENYFNSIPLITCMNTNIKLLVYLNNNSSIFKNSYVINNLTNILINTSINSDFILVERDERLSLCSKKIDNLIEKNNLYQFVKNINKLMINKTSILNVNFDFELNNMVKELIWSFEIIIDNYNISIAENISITNLFLNNKNNTTHQNLQNLNRDFILNTKFYFDGLRRDGIEFINSNTITSYNKLTTILNPYKYNTRVKLDKHYNTYSFALEPTTFQPSGAINMSNYKTFTIQIQIDKNKLIEHLKKIDALFNLKNLYIKMTITTFEYNLVRYQSSLAGTLFIS